MIPLRMCDELLLCPGCGSEYLHHHEIDIFGGTERRGFPTLEINALTADVSDGEPRDNPSLWRHGATAKFWCENCKCLPELTVAQHKGMTQIGWREPLDYDITMAEFFAREAAARAGGVFVKKKKGASR